MLFERKKIQTETLGEYLSEIRNSLNLSIEEVAQGSGFGPKFLEDLESGEFSKLPPDVYVAGFLRRLAKIYNIEAGDLVEQYKKERGIQMQLQVRRQQERASKKKPFGSLVVTPRLVSITAGTVFVIATLGYIIFQVSSINRTPSLEIFEPGDRQIIKGSAVTVRGKTDAGASVAVNDQNIFVDSEGNFKMQLGINPGPADLRVVAKNKFDKSATRTVSIVGEQEALPADSQLELKLEFSDTVTLTFSIDDADKQILVFHSGDVKQLSAKQRITVSTSNAGATKVTLNNKALGVMGRAGEKLENVPFFAESENTGSGQ